MTLFVIEDEMHAEHCGEFATLEDAVQELRRLAELDWNTAPNVAPCTNWRECGRDYELVEYDNTSTPWKELSREAALRVSAEGVDWNREFAQQQKIDT